MLVDTTSTLPQYSNVHGTVYNYELMRQTTSVPGGTRAHRGHDMVSYMVMDTTCRAQAGNRSKVGTAATSW
jgi:hypothetical protein